jgi:CubicO group peptidase (beta-lactamase class C family)
MDHPPLSPDAARAAASYLDSWLEFRQRQLRVPGVQAALAVGGDIVLSAAYGTADLETGTPMSTGHLFRIASHSKMFTAVAVLSLQESGALRLDDAVATHLPWLASSPLADRTLRELLSHGAGVIRDGHDADHWQLSAPFPDHETLRRIALDDAATLDANVRFKYSNISYSLLGEVVAAVSGTPYNDYVAERIVGRLGLENTYPELVPDRLSDYATGYSALAYADRRIPIEHVDTRAMSAATGFTSTAEDLVRFATALALGDERLLLDRSIRLMQHAEWPVSDPGRFYGLGVDIEQSQGRRVIGHGGGYPGHITRTSVDPVSAVALSVLTNAIDGPAGELATGALGIIGLAGAEPRDGERVDADADRFCGRFANLWGVTDVVRLGDRLLALSPEADDPTPTALVLAVTGPDRLTVRAGTGLDGVGEDLVYDFAPSGDVRTVRGPSGITSWPIATFADRMAGTQRVLATTGPAQPQAANSVGSASRAATSARNSLPS